MIASSLDVQNVCYALLGFAGVAASLSTYAFAAANDRHFTGLLIIGIGFWITALLALVYMATGIGAVLESACHLAVVLVSLMTTISFSRLVRSRRSSLDFS